jgi:hypothetical protein
MSIILYDDNRQAEIENDITFVDGDILLCDPGVDFCASRLFNLMTLDSALDPTGFWKDIYHTGKAPDFGSNQYALGFKSCFRYYPYDKTTFSYGESFTITHIADPNGKRYCEAWITYYPTAPYSPELLSGDLMGYSVGVSLPFKIELKVKQSITLPVEVSAYYSLFCNNYMVVSRKDNQMIIRGGPYVIIYEYNDPDWEQVFIHDCGGTVYSVAMETDKALANYADGTYCLLEMEKSGTWSITGDYEDWNVSQGHIYFYGPDNFIMSSSSLIPVRYSYDTREVSFSYYSENNKWGAVMPCTHAFKGSFYFSGYWSVLGGPTFQALGAAGISGNGYVYRLYNSDIWTPDGTGTNVNWSGVAIVGHYATIMRTEHGQCYGYSYLSKDYAGGRAITNTPSVSAGWSHYDILVNFGGPAGTNKIYYCFDIDEIVKVCDYVEATHKPWAGVLIPLDSTNNTSIINANDGTLKIVNPTIDEYDTTSPGVGVFKITTTKEITVTTNFTLPTPVAGTSYKFLLSPDNVTYYKWGGASWVVESDITAGNTYTEFAAGCVSGYTFPADCYTAYVKMAFYTTDATISPGFIWTDFRLYLTTISSLSNAYLADDSKLLIEHISDTETKFTSLMGPDVILNAVVGIVAPPYDVDYED